MADQLEADQRRYQDDDEKDGRAVFETLGLDAVRDSLDDGHSPMRAIVK